MPSTLAGQREHARHYIPASETDIRAMLDVIGKERLDDLFDHIPEDVRFAGAADLPDSPSLNSARAHVCEEGRQCRFAELSFANAGVPALTGALTSAAQRGTDRRATHQPQGGGEV